MADEPIPVLANSLMVAIENENKPELIRIFLEAYYQSKLAELVNLTFRRYNVTPLILAIQRKVDIDIIHQLVNAGADVNEKKDKTPLGELLSNIIPTSTTGKRRDIEYTAEVFIILLNKGVDVTQKSDGKTPLELARLFLTDGDEVMREGKYSKQGIIDMIEQRIKLEPSLMNLTELTKIHLDEEAPLEDLVESMEEELRKPPPESRDGKKYLQLLDICRTPSTWATVSMTPLFVMLNYTNPPKNLLIFYNLFVENYHPQTTDSGQENILDQTYDTQTPIMIFFIRFNSKTINASNNPVDLLRKMCEDLKVARDALTGVVRTGHRSRAEEINKRDMYGLTALDYAEAAGVQEYIDIIKEIHPNAKNGRDFGNISDPNSPFNGRPIKVGILQHIFGNDTSPPPPPFLADFRLFQPATPGPATPGPATPEPATPEPATPGPATPGPATPRTPDGSRVSSPSSPPPNIRRADRERSRPPPLMIGDSPEPATPTTPTTPPFSPSLLRTPDTYTPPSSPPPLRGRADNVPPPRMTGLDDSPVAADPDQIKRFFDALKAKNISDTRNVMQEAFFQNNLEALVSSTDPENAVLKNPPMVVAAKKIVEYELFLLLFYNGVDINATSGDGRGPLHYLADITNPEDFPFTLSLTNSLINQGANVFMKDNGDKTALDIALEVPEGKRPEKFELLIKEIEDRKKVQEPFQELRNIIDNLDENPIEKVVEKLGKLPLTDYIVGLEDSEGLNSLMYAIKYFAEPEHLRSIYDIIMSIDDILERTFKGKTAPMVFLEKYPIYKPETADFFSVLCSNVPDINHQDLFGLTVLDYAEKTGQQEYIDMVQAIPPGAMRGKDMPPNRDQFSMFFGQYAIYPEKEQGRTVLAAIRRKALKLPEDPVELKKMYFAEANKLISPTLTEEEAEHSLEIIDQILDKDSGMIDKYIGESGLTLLMFSTKINRTLYNSIESLMASCNTYGADVLFKSKSGYTVLELAIDEENWPVVDILLTYHSLKDLIQEEKDSIKIYNSLNTYYERYSEELKKLINREEALEEDSNEESKEKIRKEKKKLKKKINMLKILLRKVFGQLFNIVITSSSEDNYKWLPENLNRNIVNMNLGIEDLSDDKNYIETVCMGVVKSTGDVIKNNAKILEFLLKNGVHAYNELLDHKTLEEDTPFLDHKTLKNTPLGVVLFERRPPSLPSAEMVRLLLDYGAPVYLKYKTVTESGQNSKEFLWTIIEYVKERMTPTPTNLSPEDQETYKKEYEKIITLLYQGIALGVILLTPKTIVKASRSKMMFQDERAKMLENLIQFHPEAFTGYPKPTEEFEIKKIDPNKEVFDFIEFRNERIEDFLEKDRKNRVVLSDFHDKTGTFFINLESLRDLIEVDYTPLNRGEIDEDNVVIDSDNPDFNPVEPEHPRTNPMRIPVDGFNPANPDHVPVPGKKGGRGILFKCNKLNNEGSIVLVGSVDNFVPYVDLRGIAGWSLLIPILEVYDKLLNKSVEERGQYFTYKVFEENVEPLAGIGNIEWIDINNRGTNRYGGRLNYVSAAHCQAGQSGSVANLITAEPMATAGGKKRRKPSKTKKTAKRNNITVNKKNIFKKMNMNRKKTVRKKMNMNRKKSSRKKLKN
jgi:ankyrin repeat protein